MQPIDWIIVAAYLVIVTVVGFLFLKRASGSVAEYFVAGRNLPWWLAGTSLIATSFAADTPLAITGIVADQGLAGNWLWWNQVWAWILSAVLFAQLWRRSGLLTDAEFAELRYGGRGGAVLRLFKAGYYSVIISTWTLAWVMLAMQKIIAVTLPQPEWVDTLQNGIESTFGLAPGSVDVWKTVVLVVLFLAAAAYTVVSGFWGIVVTDLIQFVIAMGGSVVFAIFAVQSVGGVSELHTRLVTQFGADGAHELTRFIPADDSSKLPYSAFLIFVVVLWWNDGGGFAAQRLFSTRSDRDARLTSLWYAIGHFALRPWPWIVVALVTLVHYPDLEDRESGYPMLMMEILPAGIRGLMVASLLAAFMSTVDTHLNWNASYFVNDVYKRFLAPHSDERRCILVSRLSTVGFAALAILVAYFLTSIADAWVLLLNLQAGIGMVLMLRWVWWRVNAWSEISAMIASAIATAAVQFIRHKYGLDWPDAYCILLTVLACTVTWVTVTLLTPPCEDAHLRRFYERVRPPALLWSRFADEAARSQAASSLVLATLRVLAGSGAIYAAMFAIGKFVLADVSAGLLATTVCVVLFAIALMAGRRGDPRARPDAGRS